MNREELLLHVQSVLPELAAQVGLLLDDSAASGIARQIDAALRDLQTDTGNVAAGEALIEYHVLRRLRFALAARSEYDATAIRRNLSQVFNQVDKLLGDAAARAAAAGHPVTAAGSAGSAAVGASLVRLNLDWVEPALEEWGGA